MPKIKMPTSAPSLDMTPMVDLAFLLVTFFMLTAQFRPEEAVAVDTPSSMSSMPIPTENLMTIIVDSADRVFWDFTDKKVRRAVVEAIATIMFNYFSSKVDGITHGIDEAGFSVSQTLANKAA